MSMELTREQAINTLLSNDVFDESSIQENSPASEFYIKHLMNGYHVFDIDRAAWLNTLFQYDVGIEKALKIDDYLFNMIDEIDIMDLTIKDKELVEKANEELNLGLDFSKWLTEEVPAYQYFNEKGERIA